MTAATRADLTADLLAETREEITRADNKANILLVGAGIALTAFLAGIIAGQIDPRNAPGPVTGFGIAAALLLGTGTALLAYTVYPRIGPPSPGRARYFTEIAAQPDSDALGQALDQEAADREGRDRQQLHTLSKIVVAKYRRTQRGVTLIAAGLICSSLAGVLQFALPR